MIKAIPAILCGGAGARLWPLSRKDFPKQFLRLVDSNSLFQSTAYRLNCLEALDICLSQPIVVANEESRFIISEQLEEIGLSAQATILEPVGRNTAPALTLIALCANLNGEDPVLVVSPADQIMRDEVEFKLTAQKAIREASNGSVVLLGVTPSKPETGYGYINVANADNAIKAILDFVEKPDEESAQLYLDQGTYYWNSGIFILKPSVWLESLRRFRPDILAATEAAWNNRAIAGGNVRNIIKFNERDFLEIPSESVDYAVLERCPNTEIPIKLLELDVGWSDVGSWEAIWEASNKDEAGNVLQGDVLTANSANTLVHATTRLVTLVGVKNLAVIETADAVLVADKSCSQEVKEISNELGKRGRTEQVAHRKVLRPWGWYDLLDLGACFKVKRISVKPEESLSLQRHRHRAEHWIVVKGLAEVTKGDECFRLVANQSTYIPIGTVHRLRNPGPDDLEIVEVQTGEYLDEDDIERLEDDYAREN